MHQVAIDIQDRRAVFIGALQYVLDKGQQDDWFANATIAVLAVLSNCDSWAAIARSRSDIRLGKMPRTG